MGPFMFRTKQCVLTLAADRPPPSSFHYATARPGLSDRYCASAAAIITHVVAAKGPTIPGWRRRDTDFHAESWERLQVGYLVGNKKKPRLSGLRQDRRPFPVHTPQPQRTHPALAESVIFVLYFCVFLHSSRPPGRASCPRNVPSLGDVCRMQPILNNSAYFKCHAPAIRKLSRTHTYKHTY